MRKRNYRRGVLLVNLGSPDSPSIEDVRKYLKELLMDERVLDIPYFFRKLIVFGFILPFRSKKSAEAYQQIWWQEGSPLIVISRKIEKLLQDKIEFPVALGMRYGNPSIYSAILKLINEKVDEILLIPLFPHYAMSTYESVLEKTKEVLSKINFNIRLKLMPPFYNHPAYLEALVSNAQYYLSWNFDYLLFSYHGIPIRHIRKTDPTGNHCLKVRKCCTTPSPAHQTCYRHQVLITTGTLAKMLRLPREKYSVSFQSRLGSDSWLKPYTNEEIVRLAQSGVKRLLVMCPAFITDCIETLEEIGIRSRALFLENGGEEMRIIACLNDHPDWIAALKEFVLSDNLLKEIPLKS